MGRDWSFLAVYFALSYIVIVTRSFQVPLSNTRVVGL